MPSCSGCGNTIWCRKNYPTQPTNGIRIVLRVNCPDFHLYFPNNSRKRNRMKKIILSFVCTLIANFGIAGSMELHNGWQFRQVGTEQWLPAAVPGCNHLDLLANEKIEDPFWRTNEADLQWIDKEDWEYQTIFNVSPERLSHD